MTTHVSEMHSTQERWPAFRPTEHLRVLHVVPSLNGGGMERSLVRLLKHSTRYPQSACGRRLEHGVCILQRGDAELINACRAYGQVWMLDNTASGAWAFIALRQIIRSFRPHVVHARSTAVWLDAALASFGFRQPALALSFHGRVNLNPPTWRRRQLNAWAARQADCVLAVSNDAAGELAAAYAIPVSKLRTIPNGVDPEVFHPAVDQSEALAIRSGLGLEPTDSVVVCTANLLPIKAHDVLLRAWASVAASRPDARLLLIGSGPLHTELQRLAGELRINQTVRFLDERADVPALLRAADLFVLASRYEGCSNSTLEAMATGLPVVATDVAGMRELILPNRAGWLVAPDDPEALAEAVLAALRDPAGRERAGHAARAAAAGCFGVREWVSSYARLYAGLSAARGLRARVSTEGVACAG